MKVNLLYLIALCALLASCGKDRSNEYEERTARDHWMLDVMRQEYLWGDHLQDLSWKEYFAKPKDFFNKLTKQAPVTDSWSWCAVDTIAEDAHQRGSFNHLDSYGLDVVVMTDPTGETSRQFGRIMTVYEGSPASRCGLKRGDFITTIDGAKFTATTAKNLINGKSRTLTVEHLDVNEAEGTYVWSDQVTVELAASEYVEDKAFPIHRVLTTSAGKVAYLMCNRLTEGQTERSGTLTTYRDELSSIMASLAGVEYDAFVLDLRLCNDGTLDMACRLASYFVDESQRGQIFAKTLYREQKSASNTSIPFNDESIANHIQTKALFVITSSYTQGAAEWLIRGLRKALGDEAVFTIGTKTAGQIVTTATIPSDFFVTLHPAVAYVADADGDYAYDSGIAPDRELNERNTLYLYPYGSEKEVLLNTILDHE